MTNLEAIPEPSAAATSLPLEQAQWEQALAQIAKHSSRRSLVKLWPKWARPAEVLSWGTAVACGGPVPQLLTTLYRIAEKESRSRHAVDELRGAADVWLERIETPGLEVEDQLEALAWAYALPYLAESLDPLVWWRMLRRLQQLTTQAAAQAADASLAKLLLGAELGLALSWGIPTNGLLEAELIATSAAAAMDWFSEQSVSLETTLRRQGASCRLLLASGLRTRVLLQRVARQKLSSEQLQILWTLTVWAAATTNRDGTVVFSEVEKKWCRGDAAAHGLLHQAARSLDKESLLPAVQAALGRSGTSGRLAWTVSLPEPSLYCPEAGLAAMLPEWDVRRGRVHVWYQDDQFQLQLHSGRGQLLAGAWEVELHCDAQRLRPIGPWEEVCYHTDDDVHYLELEQAWTGDLVLQRQVMVIRDDRCVFFADAVIDRSPESKPTGQLRYQARWQMGDKIQATAERETWEITLQDNRVRGIVYPLSLPEWRVGPQAGTFAVDETGGLTLTVAGQNAVYAPLWFDLERKRLNKSRTWRQLTVAESLRIVRSSEAVAYRIEAGSDNQWFVYRSFRDRVSRTALGKNLVADFYCGRFLPESGEMDELIAVDDPPED